MNFGILTVALRPNVINWLADESCKPCPPPPPLTSSPPLPSPRRTQAASLSSSSHHLYTPLIFLMYGANFGQFYCTLKPTPAAWQAQTGDGVGEAGRDWDGSWRVREVYKYNFVNMRYGNEKGRQLFGVEFAPHGPSGPCRVDSWGVGDASWAGGGWWCSQELRLCAWRRENCVPSSCGNNKLLSLLLFLLLFSSFLAARNIWLGFD